MTTVRARTVADAMLRHPTVHPADLTLTEARTAFAAGPKTHLLLITEGDRLITTLTRTDVTSGSMAGRLLGRTVAPGADLDSIQHDMLRRGQRRLAVVDDRTRLLGLLCLKSSLTGFCTDKGVAELRRSRTADPRCHRPPAPGLIEPSA